ncbi:hypothetical protein BGW80DRAFT_1516597 [Lactifluus volemus]|nr:hypothetical protein BGW80DRAFT_1516597 [Lactifluus volemus]
MPCMVNLILQGIAFVYEGGMGIMSERRGGKRKRVEVTPFQFPSFVPSLDELLKHLMDVASLLDWDLETLYSPWSQDRLFTTIQNQNSPHDSSSMKDVAKKFRDAFPDPSIPSLPQLLATISGASSNHFYTTVVKSNDRVPMFHDVVPRMLQRDLLVTLHLRVRIVVPAVLKARARRWRDERRDRGWHTEEDDVFQSRSRHGRKVCADSGVSEMDLELFDPSPAWYMRRNAGAVEPPILDESIDRNEEIEKEKAKAEEAWKQRVPSGFERRYLGSTTGELSDRRKLQSSNPEIANFCACES